jgi:hypothetical protein
MNIVYFILVAVNKNCKIIAINTLVFKIVIKFIFQKELNLTIILIYTSINIDACPVHSDAGFL